MAESEAQTLWWIAGFLEGEGNFTYQRHSVYVRATQKQREPLERVAKALGGLVRLTKAGYHHWQVGGPRAVGVMMTLYKLMSPRRQEAILLALSVWRSGRWAFGSRGSDFCHRGHLYTFENTLRKPNGWRICRACRAENETRYRRQRKVERLGRV